MSWRHIPMMTEAKINTSVVIPGHDPTSKL